MGDARRLVPFLHRWGQRGGQRPQHRDQGAKVEMGTREELAWCGKGEGGGVVQG